MPRSSLVYYQSKDESYLDRQIPFISNLSFPTSGYKVFPLIEEILVDKNNKYYPLFRARV
jgi:hypothetical protein